MDADLQDSPEEIPEMYRMVTEEGYDVVSGWKQHRQDNRLTKNLPSKLYNATARWITGIRLHDMNCGLKAYKNEVVKNIEVYGEMHRYIPYLAKNAGFDKITEKPVHHQKRKYGKSKFGLERFVNGFLDLLSLWFLSAFGKKPMHFFGFSGLLMFLVGFIMTVWVIVAKLVHQAQGVHFRAVTDQPLFYLAILTVIIGVMLFLAGFICEMISAPPPSATATTSRTGSNNQGLPKNSRQLFFGNRVKNTIRAELSATGVGDEVAEVTVEVGTGQKVFKGDVHPPAPVVTRVGRDVDALVLGLALIADFPIDGHPVLKRKDTEHRW